MKAAYRKPIFRIPFPMAVLLLSGMLMAIFGPLPGVAADTPAAFGVQSGDEPASFDEANTGAGAETEASISPLLHPDHYEPAVYSPDRQVRTVTPTPWIRILPFGALVLLALVCSRLFSRRRRIPKIGAPAAFEKAAVIAMGVLLAALGGADISQAQRGYFPGGQGGFPKGGFPGGRGGFQSQVYATVEEGVSSLLGSDREIFQKEIDLTGDAREMLKSRTGWTPDESSIKAYYSKTAEGAVEAYAFVLTELLPKCGGTHKYCIKVTASGTVEGVEILELNCHHSFGVNSEWFLNQFDGLTAENAGSTRIDAVTRATLSSDLTRDVVLRALALFEVAEGRTNA